MESFDRFLARTRTHIQQLGGDYAAIVRAVGDDLEQLLREPPAVEGWAEPEDYNGRLLFEDPETGFIAVLMTWGPGARTSIHDHGTWGVFGVVRESVEFTNFLRVDEERVRPVARFLGTPGDVSYVIPPDQEIHQIHNPNPRIASSLHLYGRNIGF